MPNWVQTRTTITGPADDLARMIAHVSQPYTVEVENWQTGEIEMEEQTGPFLLWNIVHPAEDELDLYYQRAEREVRKYERQVWQEGQAAGLTNEEIAEKLRGNKPAKPMLDYATFTEQFEFDIAHGTDWYHWNVREWGTKWEIGQDCEVTTVQPGEIAYLWRTAWSPPVAALTKLAEQYPTLTITLRCHDEGDLYAVAMLWTNGALVSEDDLTIDHALMEDLYGYCYACEDPGDIYYSEYAETRARYNCPKQPSEAS